MRKTFPSNRKALTLAVMLAGTSFSLSAFAQQDDEDIEEIIVTGSYIRGSAIDAPSPVQVIDRDSIEAQGASVIWDVIRNLEVNSGSDTSVSGSSDAGQLTGTAQVNLRNLGGNSTLTLINGKRMTPAAVVTSSGQEFVNINSIPLVMTERVEVLTDGGSALYGADAVAGVVNIIMRTNFEGFEVYGDVQGISAKSGDYDKTVSAIWGWASDSGDTHLVLSGEVFNRDPVNVRAANFYDADAGQYNGTVGVLGSAIALAGSVINPLYLRPDLQALNNAEFGNNSRVYTDPLCETLSGPNGAFYIDNRYSDLGQNNATCRESTVDYSYVATGAERNSIAASFDHTFDNGTEIYAFGTYSDADTNIAGQGINFSRSIHFYIPPPGTHDQVPSSIAFTSRNVELGAFAALASGGVLAKPTAADITNSPLDIRNGGLGTAMQGGLNFGWPRTGITNVTQNEDATVQTGIRGDFEVGDRQFNYDVSYSWSTSSVEQNYQTIDRVKGELAIQGLGGPNCTPNGRPDFDFTKADKDTTFGYGAWSALAGYNSIPFPGYMLNLRESFSYALTSNNHGKGGCQFFNPFLTALTNPALANTPELLDWLTEDVKRADKRNKLQVIDAVVSGELFEMAGGTAQFATGLQYREQSNASRAPSINFPGVPNAILNYNPDGTPNETTYVTANLECAGCIYNFDHTRDTSSVFVELSLPWMENVETQIALRYEDYGGLIGSELSPKIAMSWRPFDELLVRGSFSQSFRAPNIGVVEESFESFGTFVQDPLGNQKVRAGLLPATNENALRRFSFTQGAPNPLLGNETADTYSAGFQWTPSGVLDGLSVGADFWRFEVTDRVLPTVPRAALQPQIDEFNKVVGDASKYILNESQRIDAPEQYVSCNPTALEAQFGRESKERLECVVDPRAYEVPVIAGQQGVQRLLHDPNAALVTLILPAINGGNIDVDGIDLSAGYVWNNDWGRFGVNLSYTHVRQYEVSAIPGLDLGLKETGITDAAGTDGDTPYVRSLPDNKGNIAFSWSRDNHRVTVINRHIGSYKVLDYDAQLPVTSIRLIDFQRPKVDSYNTWDAQYSYTHAWANDNYGSTNFTIGVIDAFSADLPMFRFQTFDRSVFDGRGSRWYARALWSF